MWGSNRFLFRSYIKPCFPSALLWEVTDANNSWSFHVSVLQSQVDFQFPTTSWGFRSYRSANSLQVTNLLSYFPNFISVLFSLCKLVLSKISSWHFNEFSAGRKSTCIWLICLPFFFFFLLEVIESFRTFCFHHTPTKI